MIQPLTADKMYLQTIALNERGDLPATRESAAEFARLYPNDPRVAEVQKLATSSNTILTLRKLQAEANRPGNDQDMGPAKASLLEALRLRERDPSAARAQLERWVNVFGNENGPIPEIKQLSAAAKDALDELRKVENVNGPQRAQQLNDWLDWAVKEAPEYQKPLIYQGIIDMYGNQAWAAEPVDRAKKLLSRLP